MVITSAVLTASTWPRAIGENWSSPLGMEQTEIPRNFWRVSSRVRTAPSGAMANLLQFAIIVGLPIENHLKFH